MEREKNTREISVVGRETTAIQIWTQRKHAPVNTSQMFVRMQLECYKNGNIMN